MYPFMTFYNIYKADASSLPRPIMLIFSGVSILILEVILVFIIPKIVKENPKRGVIIQAIYRSNFVLFGLPLTISVFGDAASSVAAMVVTVVVTIYNTTSVVILEMFNSEGKTTVKSLLLNVAKNPLLQGAVVGLVFFFLGIKVPKSLLTPIAAFADMTSPLALFVLGGTLHFHAIRGNLKYLVPTLSFKLFALPALMLAIAYQFGLRELELFLLLAIYGTPVAAASYPMAQNMGGDGELAGQFYNATSESDEKLGKIYTMIGNKPVEVSELFAGDIGAIAKLGNTKTGDTLSAKTMPLLFGAYIQGLNPTTHHRRW